MKGKKIILAGGTGFIGQEMIRYFCKENFITVLTRQLPNADNNRNHYSDLTPAELKNVHFEKWDATTKGEWTKVLEGADLLVNLAGRTVNCRYTAKNKKEILESRVDAVKALGQAIQQAIDPPRLWINASSATIYRHATDRPQDEYTGEYKDDFSVQVCKAWEKSFFEQAISATRQVALRMAITLGSGGVLIPYFNLLKWGLGGKQGNGKQMYSWIHIEDTCRMIEWITDRNDIVGIINCCSPNPVTNQEFMQTLRKITGTKFGLPVMTWQLKAGAVLIGTQTELVLKSRWVIPTKITETGFKFRYPLLKDALTDIIRKVPRKQYHLF